MTSLDQTDSIPVSRLKNIELISAAVHRHSLFSRAGVSERLFTLAFSGLVYPQIWEDPVVDIEAMALAPGHRVVTIASGGCNILSYLTAAPVEIDAVDLNAAHIALNRLKIAAAAHLERYEDFRSFFAGANDARNVAIFDDLLAQHLDPETLAYWNSRDWRGRRRVTQFAHGFYRHGLLGRFIAMGHFAARALGGNPAALMQARSLEEQREIFDRELKPLFEGRMLRWLLDSPSALFGLGIPPAQFEALREGRPMHEVIYERLEHLACDYPLSENYFAWQAFNRSYGTNEHAPLPPYLQRGNFQTMRDARSQVRLHNIAFTDHLASQPARRIDRYVLLDAQDWMGDGDLNALWREITRTARPGARVIFRTAGRDTILPGRVRQSLLDQWHYRAEESAEFTRKDRSAIYGGFHLYERAG
jgi:S-adenosylmethionine-diacylglycerol 3-amino-3-carboxypropyl transferase